MRYTISIVILTLALTVGNCKAPINESSTVVRLHKDIVKAGWELGKAVDDIVLTAAKEPSRIRAWGSDTVSRVPYLNGVKFVDLNNSTLVCQVVYNTDVLSPEDFSVSSPLPEHISDVRHEDRDILKCSPRDIVSFYGQPSKVFEPSDRSYKRYYYFYKTEISSRIGIMDVGVWFYENEPTAQLVYARIRFGTEATEWAMRGDIDVKLEELTIIQSPAISHRD